MSSLVHNVRRTGPSKLLLLPRLLAGGPLVAFSAMHFMNPQHFRDILTAAGAPMVDLTVVAASAAEMAAGVLILTGFFARIGGLLGVATMLPAILTTVKFMGMPEHPFVPPLPLPVAVLVASAVVAWLGAGAFSADRAATAAGDAPAIAG
jgi:uncharacterized membrane protein YphA (DoxX/SURF4 family)